MNPSRFRRFCGRLELRSAEHDAPVMDPRVLLGIPSLDTREELEEGSFGGMVADVIHLQGSVLDSKLAVEHLLQFAPPLVTVFAPPHQDVSGERREAGSDLPDVKVVHLLYAL
jgi:hypothetical protein